jgi:hypothetical protein
MYTVGLQIMTTFVPIVRQGIVKTLTTDGRNISGGSNSAVDNSMAVRSGGGEFFLRTHRNLPPEKKGGATGETFNSKG